MERNVMLPPDYYYYFAEWNGQIIFIYYYMKMLVGNFRVYKQKLRSIKDTYLNTICGNLELWIVLFLPFHSDMFPQQKKVSAFIPINELVLHRILHHMAASF